MTSIQTNLKLALAGSSPIVVASKEAEWNKLLNQLR